MATDSSATGTRYNQMINGAFYYTQDEFSNADYAAGQGNVTSPTDSQGVRGSNTSVPGCVQRPDTLQTPLTVSTAVDDATTAQAWTNTETTGASAIDTATVTGTSGVTPTGTVSYALYAGGSCTGTPTSEGTETLNAGAVPNSSSTGPLSVGSHSFQATYSGDGNYASATGSCEPFRVGLGPSSTSTAVVDAATGHPWTNTETTGASAFDTATVTGAPGITPTGSVSFALYPSGSCTGTPTSKGTVTLSTGTVPTSNSTGPLPVGAYSFRATYTGDSNYGNSTSACEPFTVSKGPSTTANLVKESPGGQTWTNAETTGSSAVDTATVTGAAGVTPTGTVTYTLYDNTTCTGTPAATPSIETLSGGIVPDSAPTGPLAASTYSFQAAYSGDTNYRASNEPCTNFTVNQADAKLATTVEVTGTGLPWVGSQPAGTSATDTATLTGVTGFTPTGTVTYTLYAGTTCTGTPVATPPPTTVTDGVVPNSGPTSPLAAGTYSFQATYSGDSNYLTGSDCQTFTVASQASSTDTVVKDGTSSLRWTGTEVTGATAIASATVTGGAGPNPTGTVTYTLYPGGGCTGPALGQPNVQTLTSTGTVPDSAPTQPLGAGPYSFQAAYSGDPNYSGSSNCQSFSVAKAIPETGFVVLQGPNAQPWGTSQPLAATAVGSGTVSGVPGFTPGGTVAYAFYPGATCSGTAFSSSTVTLTTLGAVPNSTPTAALPAGTYSLQATYWGDSNYQSPNPTCLSFTVTQASSRTTTTPLDAATGQPWAGNEAPGAEAAASAAVTSVAGFPPGGTVSYAFFGGAACAGSALAQSQPSLTSSGAVPNSAPTSALAAGTYSVLATYSGDTNYAGSTASCQSFTVPVPYTTVTPARLFDTRTPTGPTKGAPVGPGATITIPVRGTAGVPTTATAVALNITAVNATTPTYLTVWPRRHHPPRHQHPQRPRQPGHRQLRHRPPQPRRLHQRLQQQRNRQRPRRRRRLLQPHHRLHHRHTRPPLRHPHPHRAHQRRPRRTRRHHHHPRTRHRRRTHHRHRRRPQHHRRQRHHPHLPHRLARRHHPTRHQHPQRPRQPGHRQLRHRPPQPRRLHQRLQQQRNRQRPRRRRRLLQPHHRLHHRHTRPPLRHPHPHRAHQRRPRRTRRHHHHPRTRHRRRTRHRHRRRPQHHRRQRHHPHLPHRLARRHHPPRHQHPQRPRQPGHRQLRHRPPQPRRLHQRLQQQRNRQRPRRRRRLHPVAEGWRRRRLQPAHRPAAPGLRLGGICRI